MSINWESLNRQQIREVDAAIERRFWSDLDRKSEEESYNRGLLERQNKQFATAARSYFLEQEARKDQDAKRIFEDICFEQYPERLTRNSVGGALLVKKMFFDEGAPIGFIEVIRILAKDKLNTAREILKKSISFKQKSSKEQLDRFKELYECVSAKVFSSYHYQFVKISKDPNVSFRTHSPDEIAKLISEIR